MRSLHLSYFAGQWCSHCFFVRRIILPFFNFPFQNILFTRVDSNRLSRPRNTIEEIGWSHISLNCYKINVNIRFGCRAFHQLYASGRNVVRSVISKNCFSFVWNRLGAVLYLKVENELKIWSSNLVLYYSLLWNVFCHPVSTVIAEEF